MTGSNFDKAMGDFVEKLGAFAGIVKAAHTIITIREVDKHVEKLKKSIEDVIPKGATGKLAASLKVKRTIKKGVYGKGTYYGWRILFEGYSEYDVPLQRIANILNIGRKAGISASGRAVSNLNGIKFIDKNLSILSGIDSAIQQNVKFGGWKIDDEDLTLNDGTSIKMVDVISIASSATSFEELKRQSVFMGDE